MIEKIFFPDPIPVPTRTQKKPAGNDSGKPAFARVLEEKLPSGGLKFSQHVQERLQTRGIRLSNNDVKKLEDAVNSIESRGGRESLVMIGDAAFVVSVKNRTVITAMDRDSMQGNVFTNIDSAVVCK